jgi:ABC-2 type transport system ATP-binding protein
MAVLEIKNLKKNYGGMHAVEDISFTVKKGEIVGLLGPNGAGKTTTISMILGILEPTDGTVLINGVNVFKDRTRALQPTNFSAVYSTLPGNLTVAQNLNIFGLIYRVPNRRERISELLRDFDLQKFAFAKAGTLSSGEATRLSLAKAMINHPQLLLLDEPTASLDPSTARTMRERIRAYGKDSAILWTSHNMHEVSEVCDRVLFLSHGKILLEGDPKTLPKEHGKPNLEELFITVAREPLSLGI